MSATYKTEGNREWY